jgi:hypothetical protein
MDIPHDCMERGFCDAHGVEVERRRNMQDLVDQIPRILTAVNTIKGTLLGFSILIVLVLSGSFLYTSTVADRSEKADMVFQERQLKIATQLADLARAVSISETRHDYLLEQIKELNTNLVEDRKARHEARK